MSKNLVTVLMLAGITLLSGAVAGEQAVKLNPRIAEYISARIAEFGQISSERKALLQELARYVNSRRSIDQPARLIFICTHNSRRSHMSQLWAAVAAAYYDIDKVETYSGGTESTAFNARAVAALERAGFEITALEDVTNTNSSITATETGIENIRYAAVFAENQEPLVCFSKRYDADLNPTTDFGAVMTCSHADKNCPTVQGAAFRIAISFDDPKLADGTPHEAATYDERSAQIAREMLFVFSLVK
jgi:protein-tyrosine-phosphatase